MLAATQSVVRELRSRLIQVLVTDDGMSTAEYAIVRFYTRPSLRRSYESTAHIVLQCSHEPT